MHDGRWTLRPCPVEEARRLARELGVSEITAGVLVRRGYADRTAAAAFLAGEQPPHDPFLLGDMAAAVERIRGAVADGTKICVHGDYDVDGICATALAVLVIWLGGTWVTKYSLEEMAVYAPIAVVVVGATIGLVMLWVKIGLESYRGRRASRNAPRL